MKKKDSKKSWFYARKFEGTPEPTPFMQQKQQQNGKKYPDYFQLNADADTFRWLPYIFCSCDLKFPIFYHQNGLGICCQR